MGLRPLLLICNHVFLFEGKTTEPVRPFLLHFTPSCFKELLFVMAEDGFGVMKQAEIEYVGLGSYVML